MARQLSHDFVDRTFVDEVIVVQHQHELLLNGSKFIRQAAADHGDRRQCNAVQKLQRVMAGSREKGAHSGNQVRDKDDQIVVVFVER